MNDIEQAQLTLLNNNIPIIVKCHNTTADAMPVTQVILYPLFVNEELHKANSIYNDSSQPKGGIRVS